MPGGYEGLSGRHRTVTVTLCWRRKSSRKKGNERLCLAAPKARVSAPDGINRRHTRVTFDDIEIVAAFDIDHRKVHKRVEEAIFAKPNCTKVFQSALPVSEVVVRMGPVY